MGEALSKIKISKHNYHFDDDDWGGDDDDGNNDSESWTVTVQDVVETVSFTINAIGDATVDENIAYTSVTPNITGSPIGTVTYILGGTDAAAFTINAGTGEVSMIARDYEAPADANTDNIYEVEITATDDDAGDFAGADFDEVGDVGDGVLDGALQVAAAGFLALAHRRQQGGWERLTLSAISEMDKPASCCSRLRMWVSIASSDMMGLPAGLYEQYAIYSF